MRIAIDYTAGIRQGAGVGTYSRNLVDAMLAQDQSNQYTLLTSGRPTKERPFPTAANVRGRSIFIPDRYLNLLWYRWRLPLYATYFSGQVDVYHGLDFALPPLNGKVRKVVSVYDLTFLEHPEYAVPALAAYLNKVVPESVASADVVAAISQETRRALIERFKTPQEKITVIPCGVGAHFRRITDPVILAATRHKFGLKHPFVLHGWLYEETQRVVAELKLENRVRFLGRVSDLELITLYSMADVFAFPSFSEGFGIPPLEAMACGAPVITSNTSSLPEVVGDAALLIDPHDKHALGDAITRLLEDEQLREELRRKGYQRIQHYTWPLAARKMLSVYQKLYEGVTDFSEDEGNQQSDVGGTLA